MENSLENFPVVIGIKGLDNTDWWVRWSDRLIACEQALLFGRVKRVSWGRASERRSREEQRSRGARFSVYIKDRGFNSFASNVIKLSVNETKWSCLLARTRALILYISIWIFDFGPVKLPGLWRNGPQGLSLAPRSRVLARLASLAQIGELARRLKV